MPRYFLRALAFVLLALSVATPLPTLADNAVATPVNPHVAVVREVVNEGNPDGASGQVLQLVRYYIPPNISLPVHIHPGMQVAYVESGTLTYTVVEGTATYIRADGETGELNAGETTEFAIGDSVVEPEGMIHFGENTTDKPVILLVASLFEADVPPSSLVEMATPVP